MTSTAIGQADAAGQSDLIQAPPYRGRLLHIAFSHPGLAVGAAILFVIVLIALLAPVLWTVDPGAISPRHRLLDPSLQAWLGTDMLGRDVYSRVIYGSRVSLIVGFSVAVIATVAGMLIGLISGFVRWSDGVIMRFMDGLMAIPPILLAVSFVALYGGGLISVITAISIAEVPRVARLVRGLALSGREQLYVDAAVVSGTRTPLIIIRHILPNTLAPIIVQATYICASAMLAEAALSFIGAGVPPIIPSWGNISAEARSLWQLKPMMIAAPSFFLSLTILSINLLGDGLRDLLDPRFSKRGG